MFNSINYFKGKFDFNRLAWLIQEKGFTHEEKFDSVWATIKLSKDRVLKIFSSWIY